MELVTRFQYAGTIGEPGMFWRQLLSQLDRRGLMTQPGREEFHITWSKWFRVARAELPDLAWPQGAALFVPVQIADNSRLGANRAGRSGITRPIAGAR